MTRIYLVEDSHLVRGQLTAALANVEKTELAGWSSSAAEAVEEIRQRKPDIVVLDIQLEQGSGWDVLHALRAERLGMKIIVFTNHASYPFRSECERLGASYFFDKAMEFDQFMETVSMLAGAANS